MFLTVITETRLVRAPYRRLSRLCFVASQVVSLGSLAMVARCAEAQEAKPQGGAEQSAWYMYFGDHPVSPNWDLHLEGQYRREGLGQRWEQLLVRPGVQRHFAHGLSALVAYTYLRDYPYEGGTLGEPTTTGPQPEHRILEQLQVEHPLLGAGERAIKLEHRFRLEQRFEGTATEGVGVTDWEFAERARYRLTANVPFRWDTRGPRPDYASVYNEVFANFGPHAGTNALNQDRTYGALGWKLGDAFTAEVGYLYQYSPLPNGVVGVMNHALQVTINSKAPFRRGLRKAR